jgi:hypothetical protein
MPSLLIERNPALKVTIPKTLKFTVSEKCIMVRYDEIDTVIHPASNISKIQMHIGRQLEDSLKGQAYDGSYITIDKISGGNDWSCLIYTGQYTEQVYAFIMKHMYGVDDADEESDDLDESASSVSFPALPASVLSAKTRGRTYGSGVLGTC